MAARYVPYEVQINFSLQIVGKDILSLYQLKYRVCKK